MAGETEVLGENLPRRHLVHHKSHLTRSGLNPGRRGGKPATNRFSYSVAGCDAWYLILREERRLRLFEKRIYGPMRDGSDRRLEKTA
jgi:hypothetical protein